MSSIALATLATGCIPLPIGHTVTENPRVAGVVTGADGLPVAGVRVILSHTGNCRTTLPTQETDSSGTFSFEQVDVRRGWTWVGPYDVGAPGYALCFGVGDELSKGYVGLGGIRGAPARADSVTCVEWETVELSRVTCSGRENQFVLAGGRWTDAIGQGWYRVLLTEALRRVPRHDGPVLQPQIVVQWLEGTDAPYSLRGTRLAQMPDAQLLGAVRPILWEGRNAWVATYSTMLLGGEEGWLEVQLGAPGDSLIAEFRK